MLYPLAVLIGLLSDVGGPAHGAMIADILPERQRQDGFGILRVAGNIAWIIGPTIGGFVASRSFLAVFIMDAVVSCIVALLFYLLMPETRPQAGTEHHEASLLATFRNYQVALRDAPYLEFLSAGMLAGLVYIQMYNSLSVFLRNVHGVPPQRYGLLLSVSAVTVILFQFRMLRVMKGQPRFLLMAAGALFYMIGFGICPQRPAHSYFLGETLLPGEAQLRAAIPLLNIAAPEQATSATNQRAWRVAGLVHRSRHAPAQIESHGPTLAPSVMGPKRPVPRAQPGVRSRSPRLTALSSRAGSLFRTSARS